jgi:hypothetical protein
MSAWYAAPLEMNEGDSFRGKGYCKPSWLQCRISPDKRPLPLHLPPVPWTEKTIGKYPFFFRHGGHRCSGDLVGRTNFLIFFEWLANFEQRAKKCIELHGECVE